MVFRIPKKLSKRFNDWPSSRRARFHWPIHLKQAIKAWLPLKGFDVIDQNFSFLKSIDELRPDCFNGLEQSKILGDVSGVA